MPTFPVPGPLPVSVECPSGEVVVTSSDRDTAEVEIRALRDDDATREAVAQAVVELRGSELVIEVPKKGWTLFGREPKIRVDVQVPHGCDLSVRTASADLHASGRFGDVRGRSASGDVTVDGEAATVRVDTASGDVRAEEVAGEVAVKTASGDVTLGHVVGVVRANLVSGDLRVRAADGGASVNTVSGDVDLGAVGGGVEVRTVSGDVAIAVRPGVRIHVDATSVSGDLRSDLALDETPGAGADGQVVDIRGRTVSGDLHLRRAAAG